MRSGRIASVKNPLYSDLAHSSDDQISFVLPHARYRYAADFKVEPSDARQKSQEAGYVRKRSGRISRQSSSIQASAYPVTLAHGLTHWPSSSDQRKLKKWADDI
jgi:hypothetical protein